MKRQDLNTLLVMPTEGQDMTDDAVREPETDGPDDGHPATYAAPTVQRLGTLQELTMGGAPMTPDDGFGGAGDLGSIL
jgi:hypothetical protein